MECESIDIYMQPFAGQLVIASSALQAKSLSSIFRLRCKDELRGLRALVNIPCFKAMLISLGLANAFISPLIYC